MSALPPGTRPMPFTGGWSRARPGQLGFKPGQAREEACSEALVRQLWNLSAQIPPD